MTLFGDRGAWALEVEPLPRPPSEPDPAAAATWCALQIWVGGRNLTAHTRLDTMSGSASVRWPAAFLGRWFLGVWDDLWARAGWPLPGPMTNPLRACEILDAHIVQHDDSLDDEFLDRRDAFVRSHTLLAAAAGGVMPHVYLLREGRHVHISWHDPEEPAAPVRFHASSGRARVDAKHFIEVVTGFLEWCREQVGTRDAGFVTEVGVWLGRAHGREGAEAVLRGYVHPWASANGAVALPTLVRELAMPTGWDGEGALLDIQDVPAAVVYRALAPAMTSDDVLAIIARLRQCPANPAGAKQLQELGERLHWLASDLPHDQGYALAIQVRERLSNADGKLDVEALFTDLGIEVREDDLSDVSVAAATVWSASSGPVVLLNRTPAHSAAWARRMSLAHELCHLLVDRGRAAELMVASTPWAPPEIEQRANAFAAELLLPKSGLLRSIGSSLRPGWITDADRKAIMDEFQVGATVCRKQLQNRLGIRDDTDE